MQPPPEPASSRHIEARGGLLEAIAGRQLPYEREYHEIRAKSRGQLWQAAAAAGYLCVLLIFLAEVIAAVKVIQVLW